MPESNLLIKSLTLRNLLSFGPDTPPFPLGPLNVLIGPNGSGKSNLVDAVAFLRASSTNMRTALVGGVTEWIWKGNPNAEARVEAIVTNPFGRQSIRHTIDFAAYGQTFHLVDESIENESPYPGQSDIYFYYRFQRGRPVVNVNDVRRSLARETVEADSSIVAQRRDPDTYPEITYLSNTYEKVRIYREWVFGRGRNSVFREPQPADMRNDRLAEDYSNLGLFLNRLRGVPKAKNAILEALRDLYEGLDDFDVNVEGNTVQVRFTEGDFPIPAPRLSDGTVRYLCLLAILCDPEPPPLICIEEPELGLHPDIIPKIADLLVAASERTQLIVTTHSDILVDALTDYPETVVVCEKHEGQTSMQRLDRQSMAQWLESYRLGELWMRGHLGGTRW